MGTDQALTNQPEQGPALFGTGRSPAGRMLNRRYRLVQTIGQGGMGAVYAAQDTQLGDRLVAVKEMSMRRLTPQEVPQAVAQFQQEAYLLASLHHPNLPAIHEYFQEDERWYLVMSFIEGRTLQAVLDAAPEKKLPASEVVRIGIELCEVLDYLHTHNPQIIFRDLKPLNIMLTPKGHTCLIDFGIARHFKQDQAKDTAYYYSAGYAPPEQYGQSQTGPRSDIYSLGATLHQMASGHYPGNRPFQFAPLQSLDPAFPAWLAQLIAQMLKMEEKDRPTSAAEVKALLVNSGQMTFLGANPGSPIPPTMQASASAAFPILSTIPAPVSGTFPLSSQTLAIKPGAIRLLHTFAGHTKDIPDVALSADGGLLASFSLDQTVKLWNVQTGQRLPLLPEAEKVETSASIALSADGSTLVYTGFQDDEQDYNDQRSRWGDYPFCVWNIQASQLIRKGFAGFSGHKISHLLLSADGLVMVCSFDIYLNIYNPHIETPRYQLINHFPTSLALSANGLVLASAHTDSVFSDITLWNAQTGQESNSFRDYSSPKIASMAFNSDGSILAGGSTDGTIRLWNTQKRPLKLLRTFPCATKSVALTHDGLVLASASYGERKILLWNTKNGKLLCTLQSPTGTVSSVALSADGRLLAGGCSDGTIHIWGVKA